MTDKTRFFDVTVKNKVSNGTKVTTHLKSCKFSTLRELMLKIASECNESEDEDFISLTIKQVRENGNR